MTSASCFEKGSLVIQKGIKLWRNPHLKDINSILTTATMLSKSLLTILLSASLALATLHPASSNTKGKCPSTYNCSR
jgi:hypothetical protein